MPINQHTLWQAICQEVAQAAQSEPMLASFLHLTVLRHDSFARVLAFHLSSKLSSSTMDARALYETFMRVLESSPDIVEAAVADVAACYDRDPACDQYCLPLLYFKGYHAIQSHRINHWLWNNNRQTLAYFLQNRASEVFGVDIHPAAVFGHGIMFDHGTGIVIGETAVLGNDISLLHGVTLGGLGQTKRRPPSQGGRRRDDRRKRFHTRQHPHRQLRQNRRGQRGHPRCGRANHRGRRTSQNRGRIAQCARRRHGAIVQHR